LQKTRINKREAKGREEDIGRTQFQSAPFSRSRITNPEEQCDWAGEETAGRDEKKGRKKEGKNHLASSGA